MLRDTVADTVNKAAADTEADMVALQDTVVEDQDPAASRPLPLARLLVQTLSE